MRGLRTMSLSSRGLKPVPLKRTMCLAVASRVVWQRCKPLTRVIGLWWINPPGLICNPARCTSIPEQAKRSSRSCSRAMSHRARSQVLGGRTSLIGLRCSMSTVIGPGRMSGATLKNKPLSNGFRSAWAN
nr:MAG TPA: hypothetical protein [Caudoviricetes sp.]